MSNELVFHMPLFCCFHFFVSSIENFLVVALMLARENASWSSSCSGPHNGQQTQIIFAHSNVCLLSYTCHFSKASVFLLWKVEMSLNLSLVSLSTKAHLIAGWFWNELKSFIQSWTLRLCMVHSCTTSLEINNSEWW